jgi:hypothetical protein
MNFCGKVAIWAAEIDEACGGTKLGIQPCPTRSPSFPKRPRRSDPLPTTIVGDQDNIDAVTGLREEGPSQQRSVLGVKRLTKEGASELPERWYVNVPEGGGGALDDDDVSEGEDGDAGNIFIGICVEVELAGGDDTVYVRLRRRGGSDVHSRLLGKICPYGDTDIKEALYDWNDNDKEQCDEDDVLRVRAKDGFAKIIFKIGIYGGDRYWIEASLDPSFTNGVLTKVSDEIEVWRKVTYQVHTMERPDNYTVLNSVWGCESGSGKKPAFGDHFDMAQVQTIYRDLFIEFEPELEGVGVVAHQRIIKTSDLEEGWGSGRYYKSKAALHITFVDSIVDEKLVTSFLIETNVTGGQENSLRSGDLEGDYAEALPGLLAVNVVVDSATLVPLGAEGVEEVGLDVDRLQWRATQKEGYVCGLNVDLRNIVNGAYGLQVMCRCFEAGTAGISPNYSNATLVSVRIIEMQYADIAPDMADEAYVVVAHDMDSDRAPDDEHVGWGEGASTGGDVAVNYSKQLAAIVVHEIAHQFGLVASKLPDTDGNKHPKYDWVNVRHCTDENCVMHHAVDSDISKSPSMAFCEFCKQVVLARDLSKLPINASAPYYEEDVDGDTDEEGSNAEYEGSSEDEEGGSSGTRSEV